MKEALVVIYQSSLLSVAGGHDMCTLLVAGHAVPWGPTQWTLAMRDVLVSYPDHRPWLMLTMLGKISVH